MDKKANSVVKEVPAARLEKSYKNLSLTHLDKVFWPDEKYTKGDLIAYYEQMAKFILPYLKGRPIILHRFPDGIEGKDFYQKDIPASHPDWVKTYPVQHEGKTSHYLQIHDEHSLLYAINLGSIDLHPFLAKAQALDYPDYCVIDLDPHDIAFDHVIDAALVIHEILEKAGARHYFKTSGGKGLHIMIPFGAKYDFDQSRQFAELVCHLANEKLPHTTSIERSPAKRPKKIYLDFLQNRFGQSIVAPYVVRPWPKALVSTPLLLDEINQDLVVSAYNIQTVGQRVQKIGDILKPLLGRRINLEKVLKQLS